MKLLLPHIVEDWLSRPMIAKMISFGVIGLGNTVIDLAIFTVAYRVLTTLGFASQMTNVPLIMANVLAWLVAVSCSYIMNTMITFRAESGRVLRRKDYFSFVASGVLGVIVTTTTLVVLSNFMPVLFAKLVAIAASFVVNFTMSHFVVFRSKLPTEPPL